MPGAVAVVSVIEVPLGARFNELAAARALDGALSTTGASHFRMVSATDSVFGMDAAVSIY